MELSLAKTIAHRGAPKLAPENTLASLQAAKDHGAQWTEFDVTLSADDVALVFHDETLDRTTNGHGSITEKTFQELRQLDAGSWFSPQFRHCKIPTLQEYIQFATQLNLAINMELKTIEPERAETLVKTSLKILTQLWSSHKSPPLISSFSVTNLRWLKKLNCPYPIALNVEKWNEQHVITAEKLGCYSIHCNEKYLTADIIQKNASHHLKTLAYTVNDKSSAEKLFSLGVSAVFSDIPDLL
ncbi:MAG: hypothetical protein A3F10_07090 [Coxiella sp. RIFCSPHIGHO2_12_FULL_42_15]|nr:MAG: hypothetical protein A3F10_07090 [Coxiella sp. RIFCSPHIGHO2_12_FULL_42_15]